MNEKEQTILLRALDALRRTTGMVGHVLDVEPPFTQGLRGDACVEIRINEQDYRYVVAIKRVDRFAALGEVKHRSDEYGEQLLLVAPRITAALADKCRELDLQFLDTLGNSYLRGPGLHVLIKGQRPVAGEDVHMAEQEGSRAGSASNLRVFFVLLCKPGLLNAAYRAINQAAGVALGVIGRVFSDLNSRGYISGVKNHRILLEHQRLMQEWVTNFPLKLRPKLNSRRFRAPQSDWWKNVDITQYGAQWGGEVAAQKLTGYLRPQALTIYLCQEQGQQNLARMVAEHKLRADMHGDIEILGTFWDFADEKLLPDTVPPLLVYADLIATLDPRNLEAAKLIHEQYLVNPVSPA